MTPASQLIELEEHAAAVAAAVLQQRPTSGRDLALDAQVKTITSIYNWDVQRTDLKLHETLVKLLNFIAIFGIIVRNAFK